MEDHAARNRAFWDARSAEWVEPGRKAWARDAISNIAASGKLRALLEARGQWRR